LLTNVALLHQNSKDINHADQNKLITEIVSLQDKLVRLDKDSTKLCETILNKYDELNLLRQRGEPIDDKVKECHIFHQYKLTLISQAQKACKRSLS
jgi:predicted nuclease with TOPRIM domain